MDFFWAKIKNVGHTSPLSEKSTFFSAPQLRKKRRETENRTIIYLWAIYELYNYSTLYVIYACKTCKYMIQN